MKIARVVPILALALLALFFWQGSGQPAPDNAIPLAPPGFLDAASAEGADVSVLEAIADEAGIAAYFKAGSAIDLNDVRAEFRVVEDETGTYIIGSVPVSGYPESDDVHAYVDVDGWILVYYPQDEGWLVGDTVDWLAYYNAGNTDLTTKLESVVETLAAAATVSYTGSTHYHFQYPNATSFAVLVEQTSSSGSFDFSIPGEWTYLERSYSLAWLGNADPTTMEFTLNGTLIYDDSRGPGWHDRVSTLSPTEVPVDVTHTASFSGGNVDTVYGSIVVLYQVP